MKLEELGYYMDGKLKENLDEVPGILKKNYDCVIIVSGSGLVGLGKSTLAVQCAYNLANLLGTAFSLDNVVFDPDTLMKTAASLPKNSVIVYDEGRAGLDSARAMENVNKATMDFFQECRQYGHVIIIVLPDFFKLSETIACARSLFLLNCYQGDNLSRGFFSFYSFKKKDQLYYFGKRQIGTHARYMVTYPNFRGRFTSHMPIDKDAYEKKKLEALRTKIKSRYSDKWKLQRDIALYLLNEKAKFSHEKIEQLMKAINPNVIGDGSIQSAIEQVRSDLKFNKTEQNEVTYA